MVELDTVIKYQNVYTGNGQCGVCCLYPRVPYISTGIYSVREYILVVYTSVVLCVCLSASWDVSHGISMCTCIHVCTLCALAQTHNRNLDTQDVEV